MKKILGIILTFLIVGSGFAAFAVEAGADADYPTKGTVSITFDDALATTYTNALPILSARGLKATEYVNTGYVGKPTYMTWDQIQKLQNTYGWDVGSHTVTHPLMTEISDSQIKYEVEQSKADLVAHGINAVSFATPYGDYNNKVIAAAAAVYQSHRPFHDREYDNEYPYNKYLIYVQSIEDKTTMTEIKSWIDHAKATNTWLVLVIHDVVNGTPQDQYEAKASVVSQMADYIKSSGIRNATVSDMLKYNKTNMLANSTFAAGITNGWTTDNTSAVTVDTSGKGSWPESKTSIKMVGTTTASHLFSAVTEVNPNATYELQAFTSTNSFTAGEFGYYIDEYDTNGNWISGRWLAGYAGTSKDVFEASFIYTPTSQNVKTMMLEAYMTAGSKGTVYIDSVEMYKLMETAPAPTATPVVTASPSPSMSASPSPTMTATPSASSSATPIASASATPTATPQATNTPKPSATGTTKPSSTPTATPKQSATPKPTSTVKPSSTPKPTVTPSPSPTPMVGAHNPDNLVKNYGFSSSDGTNSWIRDWTRDSSQFVVWDDNKRGCEGGHSVYFTESNTSAVHLFSHLITVDSTKSYEWTSCINAGAGTGEFGFYIDEYDVNGNWVSGQWLGTAEIGKDAIVKLNYKPTNSSIKKISLQYYKDKNTTFSVDVDAVYFLVK